LARYDFLFLYALAIQIILLKTKMETWDEAKVILIFHIVGTIMELFKTQVGSWAYPEENVIRIMGVPLFSGFMYASVGSYLARVWRAFDFRFDHYPPVWVTACVAGAIYINFFSHHYWVDFRLALFVCTALMFRRTWIYFSVVQGRYRMPVLLAIFLGAFFIWVAENIATYGGVWLYPHQTQAWELVPLSKLGSWFLLMIISGVLLTFVQQPEEENHRT
jgi:uncharacterized membrane protein YoaT (DUF817 family)